MRAEGRHRIRELNDAFRQKLKGGRVALSAGVAALPVVVMIDRFAAHNNSQGEHEFGLPDVGGEHLH